jgi:hypothetical protein
MFVQEHQNLLPAEFDILPDWREQLYYWYLYLICSMLFINYI